MSEELNPCPFCGGEAKFTEHNGCLSEVWCVRCGTSSGLFTKNSAVKRWNTRPAEDALKAEIEQLTAELEELRDMVKNLPAL